MSSVATSNNDTLPIVRRELIIASSFVKSYYTLLNKGPQYIHNFYSDHSTFIHGTVENPNDNQSGPVVGRNNISKKIKELNLNDCRAKITQIDCLETLSDALLIQVVGELSNNGQPMRRFLQTFVLARSPDDVKNENNNAHFNRRHPEQLNNQQNSNSTNEKFYVRNSIFRYQDDGSESEVEDEPLHHPTPATVASTTDLNPTLNTLSGLKSKPVVSSKIAYSNGSSTLEVDKVEAQGIELLDKMNAKTEVDKISTNLKETVSFNKKQMQAKSEDQCKQASPANGTGDFIKVDVSEKNPNDINLGDKTGIQIPSSAPTNMPSPSVAPITNNPASQTSQSIKPAHYTPSEPKTWANMVRSNHSSASPAYNATTPQQSKPLLASPEQQPTNHNQSSAYNQQNQQSRRRLNKKSSNKGTGGNRPANKLRTQRSTTSTTPNLASAKQQVA